MTDEAFHLTPLDIRRFDFGSALRGYDRARVDLFREQVANEVERLVKQCQVLEGKAQGFHEQLRAFRERDKALNDALISAQQLRAEMREQAEREGQLLIREAKADAERIVAAARQETQRVAGDLDALVRQRRAYLAQLRQVVERHLSEIEAAEQGAEPGSQHPPPPARVLEHPPAPDTPEWLNALGQDASTDHRDVGA